MAAPTPAIPQDHSQSEQSPYEHLVLDPSIYNPSKESVDFFKKVTGISDDDELKQHIIDVQKDAWHTVKYMCIRNFGFTKLTITNHFAYPDLFNLVKQRPDALYLEFACCFGNDARKAIVDGYPLNNVIMSDVEPTFWELGHKLFRTTKESFPVPFVPGSIFDDSFIPQDPPLLTNAQPESPRPALHDPTTDGRPNDFTSLAPFRGHISVIHVAAFFHLFTESEQLTAARALASLLSPTPGSFIFGRHSASDVPRLRPVPNVRGRRIYQHSPESWTELWDGVVFPKGSVEVRAELREADWARVDDPQLREIRKKESGNFHMIWSVKRL